MSNVKDGPSSVIYPVEDKVTEQLECISLSILRPAGIVFEFLPLVDHTKFHEKSYNAAIFKFPLELAGEHIGMLQILVKAFHHVVRHARDELVGALFSRRKKKPLHEISQSRFSLWTGLILSGNSGHLRVQVDQLVCKFTVCKTQNQTSELHKVILLEFLDRSMCLELDNIKNGASGQSNPILVGDDDLARVETTGGEVPGMNGSQRIGYLHDIRPYNVFGNFRWRAGTAISVVFLWLRQVDFNEGLRERKIVLSKYERPVTEGRGGEGIVHEDNIAIVNLFPLFDGLDGLGCFAISETVILDPPQAINPARLGGERLEQPTCPTKYARVLSVWSVQLV